MGWRDAPLVEDKAPAGEQPSWMSAPEVGEDQPDYGLREDGTRKGSGYYGPLQSKDPRFPKGSISTELSADVDIDGKKLHFPLLAPGLSRKEIDSLLAGQKPTDAIYDKAISHAQQRIATGKSPFAGPDDGQIEVPNYEEPSMAAVAMNAVPKGVAGAFQNAYDMAAQSFMGQVVKHGLAAMTGNKNLSEQPDMQARAVEAGFIDPAKNPQTGPQKIVDAMIQGAVTSAAIPGPSVRGAIKAVGMGAVAGGAGKTVETATKDIVGDDLSHLLGVATGAIVPLTPLAKPTFRAVKPAPQSPLNTKTRMETLKAAQAEGFVVEPENIRPSVGNNIRSSIAGGGKLRIATAMQNQKAATELAKKELNLPPEAELTEPFFRALKTEAGKPYRELEKIAGGKNLLEQVQQKRSDAAALWRSYANAEKPPPDLRNAAMAADAEAHKLEDAIDALAQQSGVKGLVDRIRGARTAFAKIYDVEAATNIGDGHVSLPILGAMLDGGRPLSGRLQVAAKFQNAFKTVAREGASLGTTASGTDAASAATLGTIASAGSGSLLSMLAGSVPFARQWARNKSLSPKVQQSLTQIDPNLLRLSLRPDAVRGLSRAALLGKTMLDNREEAD